MGAGEGAPYVTIKNGDRLDVYPLGTLPAITIADTENTGGMNISRVHILGNGSIPLTNLAYFTVVSECTFNTIVVTYSTYGGPILIGNYYTNPYIEYGYAGINVQANFYGGWINGAAPVFTGFTLLDGDIVIPLRIHFLPPAQIALSSVYFGQINDADLGGYTEFDVFVGYNSTRIWGPGGINAQGASLVNYTGAGIAGSVLLTEPPQIDSSNTGWYFAVSDAGVGSYKAEAMTWTGVDTRTGYVNARNGGNDSIRDVVPP